MQSFSYLPWIPVLVGAITAFISIVYSFRMKGSVFENVLRAFGLGIFVGVCSLVLDNWKFINSDTQEAFHDALMIVSYLFMALGVWRFKDIT